MLNMRNFKKAKTYGRQNSLEVLSKRALIKGLLVGWLPSLPVDGNNQNPILGLTGRRANQQGLSCCNYYILKSSSKRF